MAHTKPGSVKETGARAGAKLSGHQKVANGGLLLRVTERQDKGIGENVKGEFELIRAGGKYEPYLIDFVGKTVTAKQVSDFIKRKKKMRLRGPTIFECGMLKLATRADIGDLDGLTVKQDEAEPSGEVDRDKHDSDKMPVADAFDDVTAHSTEFDHLTVTERAAIVKSRIGQGAFRQGLIDLWGGCAVTGVTNPSLLRASHAKPWRDATNEERLNPHNGILLIPNLDHLFDKGLITFDQTGMMRVSVILSSIDRQQLGISTAAKLRKLPKETKPFLHYHSCSVFVDSSG